MATEINHGATRRRLPGAAQIRERTTHARAFVVSNHDLASRPDITRDDANECAGFLWRAKKIVARAGRAANH
jgi:hypothetical protein